MKKVILILCGIVYVIATFAQASGGQIVRKKTPKVVQSPNKLATQKGNGSGKSTSANNHIDRAVKSDERFFRYDLIGNQNIYDELVYGFREDMALVIYNGKYGFIDKSGYNVIPCRFDGAKDFSEGIAPVKLDGKWGFINKSGSIIIACKYDAAYPFHEGLGMVEVNDKRGFVDRNGREVVPCRYDITHSRDYAYGFRGGLALVCFGGKYGFIDKTGREVIPCKYDGARDFSEGVAWVILNGLGGYIDKTGVEVIKLNEKYKYSASRFSNGLAKFRRGFIDKSGQIAIPDNFELSEDFSDGLALVWKNDKKGFIDKTGRMIISCSKYSNAVSFRDGLARVCRNGKWGFIDKNGREVISCRYGYVFDFSEGFAAVTFGYNGGFYGKWGFIDKTGKLLRMK